MMKVVFVCLALVLCAMAQFPVFPSDIMFICSMSGSGKATIPHVGEFSFKMIRVRDTARYDLLDSNNNVVASVVTRPDLESSFFYYSQSCVSLDEYFPLRSYTLNVSNTEGQYEFNYGPVTPVARMTFSKKLDILSEFFVLPVVGTVTFEYSSFDYSYRHDVEDDAFSLDNDGCPEAKSKATQAKSELCEIIPMPDNICSISAVGKASVNEKDLFVKMIRVGSTARYDFFDDSAMTEFYASFIERVGTVFSNFFYAPSLHICDDDDYPPLIDLFNSEGTTDGLDVFSFSHDSRFVMVFDHNTHILVKEVLPIYGADVTINYSSVNYDYIHNENDDAFSVDDEMCPEDLNRTANALSSQCPKKVSVVRPGCAFEMLGTDVNVEVLSKVLMKGDDGFAVMNVTDLKTHTSSMMTLRCDIKLSTGACFAHYNTSDTCMSYYSSFSSYFYKSYSYVGEPENVACPDGSDGCKKYCDASGFSCITLDKDGRLSAQDDVIVTYTDYIPTVDDFKGYLACDGEDFVVPENPCIPDPSSSISDSSSNSGTSTYSSTTSSTSGVSSSVSGVSSSVSSTSPSSAVPPSAVSSAAFPLPSILLLLVFVLFALF